jgi:hypothetical protein
MVALLTVAVFHDPIARLFERFSESEGSKAELGPIHIELGTAVLPPQYRAAVGSQVSDEVIDLSADIGMIRDTGPEATTAGVAVAYASQAILKRKRGQDVMLSPRGVYVFAKRYDQWPGEDYEGTSVEGALKAVTAIGLYSETMWPYSRKSEPVGVAAEYHISNYSELNGVNNIIDALRTGEVVVATVSVTSDFDSPDENGRVTIRLPLRELGGKALAIVGYDRKKAEFKFANDWGVSWGRRGFGTIRDTDLVRILQDAYALQV